MEVVLLLSAERDLQEAYNWVEEHRRGREQFFLQDVELRFEHLKRFPLIGRLYRGRYRRLADVMDLVAAERPSVEHFSPDRD